MSEGLRVYNLLPTLAGPVERWREALPRIAGMAFNAVYLNPFHYPGFSGSIYAVKDYYRLNPLLRGKARAGDDELLRGFTKAAAEHGLRVIMDLVVNHTAKDSPLTAERPHWFAREPDGRLHSPFATDPADPSHKTVWGDLAEIDYGRPQRDEIVAYFERLVRHYVGLGFAGFRCDAAYKVPAGVWRRLIGAARSVQPDVLFLAETLGAPVEDVLALDGAGFDYLFNSVKWWDFESGWLLDQYERFRHIAPSIGFPESHDTDRLVNELIAGGVPQSEIEPRYRRAYAFAAAFSTGVMLPMGYEYGWSERFDVTAPGRKRPEPARFDLAPFIAAVNRIKAAVPALNDEGPQRLLTDQDDPLVALLRISETGGERALVLVNTHERAAREVLLQALVDRAGLTNLGDRLGVTEPRDDGSERAVEARLSVAPHEVKILRASVMPARRVETRTGPAVARDPAHHPAWRPEARIAVEGVYPELDGGRYPVKRIVGEEVAVWADIFRDGHDKIAAVLKFAFEDEPWRETPFGFQDNDRWTARFRPDRVGRWRYTIEAWTDRFDSWRDDLVKKRGAGQPVSLELQEGLELVAAAIPEAGAADAAQLRRLFDDAAEGDETRRAALMLSPELRTLMARADSRADRVRYARELEIVVDRPEARFSAWYEMFPRSQGRDPERSATFDDCIARLPDIAALGFDVVYLVPIHPIGRVNRKGRDNAVTAAPGDPGSPYAIGASEGGHRAVHAELGTLEDFRRFVAAAAEHGMEVALDFAVQCAPDHPWVRKHKKWFNFRPDGTIKYAENPPKKYEDIVNVDFYNPDRERLWKELRDTVLFWVKQGVRIFRVDNPHTKPVPFWEWMIREVKARCPEVIFLSEAFTRPKMMRLLAKAGFTQSYTYFTWRNHKAELIEYMTELADGPAKEYFRPNFFTNTPDILPVFLQEGGRPAFRIRLVLAATLSPAYGIYNGYELCENTGIPGREEYLHSEKYQYRVWDWDRSGHIKRDVAILNRFRRENPALHRLDNLRFIECGDPQILAYVKFSEDRSNLVLMVVNLDPHRLHAADVVLPLAELGLAGDREHRFEEAFTGQILPWRGDRHHIALDPQAYPALVLRLLPPIET
ncbi:MAG TPA: maltotransferase domain-containing protein [Stellaceae bacterium]|jgi:starch synthase (maltosyl-transferring)|nr:maltotransferase domain-containing protein [Stellaceae bacterium]